MKQEDILRYISLMGRRQKEYFAMAREGLLKIGVAASGPLVDVLLNHKNSFMRRHAAMILGELGDKAALAPLIRALDDRMPAVRWSAAIALGLLKDNRAVPMLKRQLKSQIWQLRVNSAVSLGWIGDKRALSSLLKSLKDSHHMVRRAAAFALSKFNAALVKEKLMGLLLGVRFPVVEAALSLTFMGELHGYFVLGTISPHMIWTLPKIKTSKKNNSKLKRTNAISKRLNKVQQGVALANIFARSGLYSQAVTEYRNVLALTQPIPSLWASVVLNNIGCMFRGIGHLEQAYFFFSMAYKLNASKREIRENFIIAESLIEMREIIADRIQHHLKLGEKGLPMSRESADLLSGLLLPSREQFPSVNTDQWNTIQGLLKSFFVLGYRVYQAFLAFRGEEHIQVSSLIPFDFFEDQLPEMESLFTKEVPFIMYRDLLLVLMDKFRKSLLVQHSRYRKVEELLGGEIVNLVFMRGFLVGFLEKIWQSLHQPISLN